MEAANGRDTAVKEWAYSGSSDVESDSDSEDEEYHNLDGSILDEDTLLQIKRDDPNVTSVDVHCFDQCINGKDSGHFIGENSHLKKLLVDGKSMTWEDDHFFRTSCLLARFCKGLAQNRSIEQLTISCCNLSIWDESNPRIKKLQRFTIMKLAQFCHQNTNLQSLKIDCCELGDTSTRVLAWVLAKKGNKSSLRRINLFANAIGDNAAEGLIESLKGYRNLVELSLGDNNVGVRGCAALGRLVLSPKTKLKKLNLQNNKIDDNGITILTRALADNMTLKEVDLDFNSNITVAGWQIFFTSLQNSSSSIEHLYLGSNEITDRGITDLGNALVNNTTLKVLDFSTQVQLINPITAAGWHSFFACLQDSKSALQDILLRGCSIDKEGLVVLANALKNNSRIKILDLSDNPQPSSAAWRQFFATSLQASNSSLEGLFLCRNFTEDVDELIADLAGAVADNETLTAIDLGENSSITNTGWSHFSRILCDKSSIANIYASNHTLSYLGPQRLPPDLDSLVDLNEHENKKELAREKILRYHFQDCSYMQEIVDMKLNVLPRAISWLGRDVFGRDRKKPSLLYQLLRSTPSLFESKSASMAGAKRKRCL